MSRHRSLLRFGHTLTLTRSLLTRTSSTRVSPLAIAPTRDLSYCASQTPTVALALAASATHSALCYRLNFVLSRRFLSGSLVRNIKVNSTRGSNQRKMSIRRATHQGAWYSDNARVLTNELNSWLSKVTETLAGARALIAPHAGYRYSGETAAHAYKQLQLNTKARRILIFGPSHVYYLQGCAVTRLSIHETPLGNLNVDMAVLDKLRATKKYGLIPYESDEDEHSIEMQYPYIKLVTEGRENVSIVPVIVGELTPTTARELAQHFLPYMRDDENFFVISSDFCHWGQRFRYKPYQDQGERIWECIKQLDRKGMDLIEKLDLEGFYNYLEETENTICGRNPILLFLAIVEAYNKERAAAGTSTIAGASEAAPSVAEGVSETKSEADSELAFKFIHYAQSDKVKKPSDHSVSYAAGAAYPCACASGDVAASTGQTKE